MNEHLSADQISRWMVGERTGSEERHVGQCARCAAELERLASAIGLFRESARDWSEHVAGAQPSWMPGTGGGARAGRRAPGWRRMAAAAALVVLAAIPAARIAHNRQEAERARADAALVEQVDAHISRAVPESMAPLVQLVSWVPNSDAGRKIPAADERR